MVEFKTSESFHHLDYGPIRHLLTAIDCEKSPRIWKVKWLLCRYVLVFLYLNTKFLFTFSKAVLKGTSRHRNQLKIQYFSDLKGYLNNNPLVLIFS